MVVDSQRSPMHTCSPWPQLIAKTDKVRDVKISPDGCTIMYQVQPFYKEERAMSSLWIAWTDVPFSARQLTDGQSNDQAGVFHPDNKQIFFLSDKMDLGKPAKIFRLTIKSKLDVDAKEEPELVLSRKNGVQAFQLSPNGRLIAFTGIGDLEAEEQRCKNVVKDDAKVYRGGIADSSGFSRLFVYSFETNSYWRIEGIPRDRHIESFSWSPDSENILFRLRLGRGSEYAEQDISVGIVPVAEGNGQTAAEIGAYPRSPSGQLIWKSPTVVVSLQNFEPTSILDARALFVQDLCDGIMPFETGSGTRRLYGSVEDAVRVVDMDLGFCTARQEDGLIAVEVSSDVDTHIDVILIERTSAGTQINKTYTLFRTDMEAIWFGAWDAKRIVSNDGNVSYVFAAVLSSGPRHEPPNVYTRRVAADGRVLLPKLQLSSHLHWMVHAPAIKTEVMYWKSRDGTELSGLVRYPPGYEPSAGRLPTILFIHGGPYRRDIPGRLTDYMPYFCNWRELLALEGYLVISPNYRGSQGRGHAFAYAANSGIGAYDWPDCESMIDDAIKRGLADPNRLGVAGWSHGGSLTAWGVTQTQTRFKAAVVGAGVSHWESMVMESGSPELETAIGQRAPWECDENGGLNRKASPVHCVSGVSTAVLILHGEKDERVPVGQGIGLYRALRRKGSERAREAAELVLYPREPHGFVERKHAEDVLRRVVTHFATWM